MQYLILLTVLLLFRQINSNESPYMSGFYTDGLDKAIDNIEIVYPERVSKDGSFVSHYLPHFYDIESMEHRPRRMSGNNRGRRDETIHFEVPIDGELNHLELWPNLNFISPSLVVERRDARDVNNINKAKISHISSKQCHYNGHIVGKPDSSVALSTCYGLAGYIRIPDGEEYLIEPVKDSRPATDKEHPHIIYKRSAFKEPHGGSNCLTKGRAKDALNERMKWESMFGDQVRQEYSGININEIMRDNIEGHNEFDPRNQPSGDKYRYDVLKYPTAADGQSDKDGIYSQNMQTKMNSFLDDPQNEKSNSEMMNRKINYGNKLKHKSIQEKNMGNIKFPEDNIQPVIHFEQAQLHETNNNKRKEMNKNEGKVFKRDLTIEANDNSKSDTDLNKNEYTDGKGESCDSTKLSSSETLTGNDENNKLGNKEKGRRDVSHNSGSTAIESGKIDNSFNADTNNKKDRMANCQDHDSLEQHNDQSVSKTDDSKFNNGVGINTNVKYVPTANLKNAGQNSKECRILNTQNQKANIEQGNEIEQISKDFINGKLNIDKVHEKRFDKDLENKLPSDQFISNKNIEAFRKLEKGSDNIITNSINANEEHLNNNDIPSILEGNKQNKEKDIYEYLRDIGFQTRVNQQQNYANPTVHNDENEYLTKNKDLDNDNSHIQILTNSKENGMSIEKGFGLERNGFSETEKQNKRVNPSLGQEILIHIKYPEGSGYKSGANDVGSRSNDNQISLGTDTAQSIRDKVNAMSYNALGSNTKNKLSIEKESMNDLKGSESLNYKYSDVDRTKTQNEYGSKKVKRHDNTIHLIIETEPEINNAEFNNMNSKSGLFCQGNNCLEIKPVLLNTSSSNTVGFNNNTNTAESKAKNIRKRYAFDDDCSTETTTEKPLLCFDLYNKIFNLELMVTVDYKVVKMHDDDDIENFILTVINMVSTNFFDRSIEINFNVVLVRLILLTTCIKELDSDRFNPEELLENFCTWQVLINPGKDDHPHHHDLAILVTRMDKCEGQVLGVTYMTSVCRPDKACLVCVDEGLLMANTITHQIGHSLGAEHDESESSGCSSHSPLGIPYLMAPFISETSNAWSECSKDAIIQFVKTQGSWCLTDLPMDKQFNFPLMLPGQIYSAAQQCRLNYHMTSIPCSVGSFCHKLYCQVTDKICATKGDPPADGTFCAADMWCFHKQCVHIGRRPGAVNGEWGPWTEWSVCTRSCGGGVSTSFRICNNPKPSNGGRFCIGDRIRHKMCATNPCQGFTESFRDLQCKKTEDRTFRGRYHNWIQYHSHFVNIECALVCQNRKGDVVMRSPVVADGTPCKAGTRNVCIQGTCRNVGCDFVIDSNAKEDSCGICHGNSTECKIIQGVFDEPTTQKGLVEFLRIPKGSGMIFVREIAPSANVIVVSGSINRVFYLNGGTEDSMPGDVSFGLAHGVYEVRSLMERIFIRGPSSEELVFYILFREPNKGIHYQYAIPETDPTYVPRYLWQFLDWDPCTDPCSGGSQRAHAKCVEDRGGVVDDQYCTESTRPMDVIRPCNDFPCQAKWWVSVWSDCICTGASSVMFRSVLCMRATDESGTRTEIVKEAECAAQKKPPTQKPCNATDEDNECFKRSIHDDSIIGSRKHVRRAVNPKTAYSAFTPYKGKEQCEEKEKSSSIKSQRNAIKPQGMESNVDETNKTKAKLSEKGSLDTDKNKKAFKDKYDEATLKKDNKPLSYKGAQVPVKDEALPAGLGKGNQVAMLNVKNGESLPVGSNSLKSVDKAKQVEAGTSNANGQADEKCETTPDSSCPTQEHDTTKLSTCKPTSPVQPHDKTTCCKTTPLRPMHMKTDETTTIRPIVVKMDEANMDNFAVTLVPIDYPNKKKLPLTDPEFMNLGEMGQLGVGDEQNGTILSGQEAVDFLDFIRSNASEEPVVLHEEMHHN